MKTTQSKKLLLLTLLLPSVLMSCFKVDKDDPSAEKPSGNWVLAGMNHSANVMERSGSNVHFMASPTAMVWARYSAQPTTSISSYKVVKGPAATLAADEMILEIDYGMNESWYSTGTGNYTATVLRDGLGNIRITVPSVTVRHYLNNVIQADSTQGSCVLIYK
jgi:hypothetical protein